MGNWSSRVLPRPHRLGGQQASGQVVATAVLVSVEVGVFAGLV